MVAVLASAELFSGHISTILGPDIGPKAAAVLLLISSFINMYRQKR